MNLIRLALAAVLGALLVLPASADEPAAGGAQADMMQKWQAYAAPGPEHQRLARHLGQWDVEMSMLLAAGAPEQKSQLKAECRWQIPDRWVACSSQGTFLGQPHHSFSLWGYDRFRKTWVLTTVDSASTALNQVEGVSVDPKDELMVLYGTLDEFLSGEQDKPYKVVVRWRDADHHSVEVWDLSTGENGTRVVNMAYSRRK